MSTLILDELYAGVIFSQKLNINRNVGVRYVRPWIYKQGTLVDGELTCRIKDGVTLIQEVSIDYTDINSAITATYAHGFIRFDFEAVDLKLPDESTSHEYTIEFEMTNHTTDLNNFIGINRSWENSIYPTPTPAPNDTVEPAGIEIYEFKEKLNG